MFAIIEIFMDFDYVETVKHIISYPTYEQAIFYIEDENRENQKLWVKYVSYVDNYINNINIPEWKDYNSWTKFISKYHVKDGGRESFKRSVKDKILNIGHIDFPDFFPPEKRYNRNLHIVEIKEI